jgi:anti-sigma regulatory factor (Ser/Thr protein kinase)
VSQGRPALRLEVPSESAFLGLVREVTRKMAGVAGFEDKTADQLALAVDEAASNVLEHAYRGAPDRVLRVDMDDHGEAFCVNVVDDGECFDPASRPSLDVRQLERDRRTGGLGVHLMERIMDSVTFQRREPLNVCCLVKRKRSV